jgi:hypothetical protein
MLRQRGRAVPAMTSRRSMRDRFPLDRTAPSAAMGFRSGLAPSPHHCGAAFALPQAFSPLLRCEHEAWEDFPPAVGPKNLVGRQDQHNKGPS